MNPFRSLFKQAEVAEEDTSNKTNVGKTHYTITLKSSSEYKPGQSTSWTLTGATSHYLSINARSKFQDQIEACKSGFIEFEEGIFVPVSDVKSIQAVHEDYWVELRRRDTW